MDNDWDRLEEGLRDSLWTNNVVKYMEQYVVYKQLQNTSSNIDYAKSFRQVMAIIHRDGGHYLDEHGPEKSAKDAIDKYYKMMTELEAKEQVK